MKSNSVNTQDVIKDKKVVDLFESQRGYPGSEVLKIKTKKMPKELLSIGDLSAVIYKSNRDTGEDGEQEEFIHYFDNEPILATSGTGKDLFILDYTGSVTEKGIEG